MLCVANIYIAGTTKICGPSDVAWAAAIYGSGAVLAAGLRLVYRRADNRAREMKLLVAIAIASSVAAAVLWQLFEKSLIAWIYPESFAEQGGWRWAFAPAKYPGRIFNMTWPFMMWSILYFVINFWREWRREQARAMKAALLAQKAQLQMLRYQLNPHFLFNALNSIRALVDENKDSARAMITELAEFLRYSLIHRDYAPVPLTNEMEAISLYLSIQGRRYEEKLEVTAEVSAEAGRYPIPCFLIHPIVENAVKYGMQTSPMPLRIAIRADASDGNLRLSVSNTGRWVEPGSAERIEGGTGTGLANVRQRLATAFPNRHKLAVSEKDGWVIVELEIQGAGESREQPEAGRSGGEDSGDG